MSVSDHCLSFYFKDNRSAWSILWFLKNFTANKPISYRNVIIDHFFLIEIKFHKSHMNNANAS